MFAFAPTPETIILAMALNGAGCSAVLMASVFIFAKSFSAGRLTILISWLVAFGTLGRRGRKLTERPLDSESFWAPTAERAVGSQPSSQLCRDFLSSPLGLLF